MREQEPWFHNGLRDGLIDWMTGGKLPVTDYLWTAMTDLPELTDEDLIDRFEEVVDSVLNTDVSRENYKRVRSELLRRLTAPDAPASAAPADDTEMRDIIRDWWLNAETREPDAQEPTDLPDTLTRYLATRGYVITAPDALSGTVCIDWATAHLLANLCRSHGYPGTAMYLDDQMTAAVSEKGNT